jgi:hypothetical protein
MVGGLRALVIASAATLVASVLVLMVSRGQPSQESDPAGLALLPIVPAESPQTTPTPVAPPTSASAVESASGSPSASVSSSRPPRTSAPPRAGFAAQHEDRLSWRDTQLSRITIRNTGGLSGTWTVALGFEEGVRVERHWVISGGSAGFAQDGSAVRFTGSLGPGGTIVVEYQARSFGAASGLPRSCAVNGVVCG